MRVSRKNRVVDSQEVVKYSHPIGNPREIPELSGYMRLNGASDTLVKPVVNNDEILEMSEAEYVKKFHIKTETFKEQACKVLNILESKGVNIYSEDNYPGMYLRRKGVQAPPAGLSSYFRGKRKAESTEQKSSEDGISQELKNFFKSKNK